MVALKMLELTADSKLFAIFGDSLASIEIDAHFFSLWDAVCGLDQVIIREQKLVQEDLAISFMDKVK